MAFICQLCSRSYSNNKQLTRHIRYCRSKVREGVCPRRKSCAACIKAKTRCDLGLPRCSRCTNKARQCLYQFSNVSTNLDDPVGELVPRVEATLDHVSPQTASNWSFDQISLHASGHSLDGLYHISAGDDLYHTFSPQILPDTASNPGIGYSDGTAYLDRMLDLTSSSPILQSFPFNTSLRPQFNHFKDRVVLGSFHVISLTPSFVHLDTKTIIEKKYANAGHHGWPLGQIYCLSILRSYPEILCSSNGRLPPFIHAQCQASASLQTDPKYVEILPEPLAICSSIMRMYLARSPGNLAFIWRTIQAESARIEIEYRFYDSRTTLGSIQAMTMYLILGLLANDSEHIPDGDIPMSLLNTTKSMADTLRASGWLCTESTVNEVPAWEEWVQIESLRRTAVILVLIIHIFNIEHRPGLPQCGGLADLPLPCCKALWRASHRKSWEMEYKRQYLENGRRWKRVPRFRDLLPECRDERGVGDLGQWFVGMDEMGSLVTMAVSLL